MPAQRDYYDVLGLHRSTSPDDIKRAFRRLARTHHPDVNQNSPEAVERFKEINEAYEVLSDPGKRQRYDLHGHAGAREQAGFSGPGAGAGFGDIFDVFFGGGQGAGPAGPEPGADLRYDLKLTFHEAALGVEKTISLNRRERCEACAGSGAEPGTQPSGCPTCRGAGQVRRNQSTFLGTFSTVTTCPRCHGRGLIIPNPCASCRGEGRVRQRADIPFKVEAGASNDMRVRVRGEGEHGEPGAPPGDLYVFFHVRAHRVFRRNGRHLECTVDIPMSVAALGGTVEAPTLHEPATLDVPTGTQPGDVFRIRGGGIPDYGRSNPGDLHVVCRVVIPKRINRRQREALEQYAEASGELESTRQRGGHGLFEWVQNIFHREDEADDATPDEAEVGDEAGARR